MRNVRTEPAADGRQQCDVPGPAVNRSRGAGQVALSTAAAPGIEPGRSRRWRRVPAPPGG